MSKRIGYAGKGRKIPQTKKKLEKGKNTKKDMEQNKQIVKLAKKVRNLEKQPELKWVDEYNPSTFIGTPGEVYNPVTPRPVQGTDVNERIGNSIMLTSIHWNILLRTHSQNLDITRVRILVVIDREFETGNPTLAGPPTSPAILDNSTVTDATLSPRNFNYVDRYEIVYDRTHTFQPQVVGDYNPVTGGTEAVIPVGIHRKISLKRKHKIQFNESTGTIAGINGWCPLLYLVSDRPSLPTDMRPLATVGMRLYFRDS